MGKWSIRPAALLTIQSIDEQMFDLPHLSDDSRCTLDRDLTTKIDSALMSLENILTDILVQIYLLFFNRKLLPDALRTLYISLICNDLKNYFDLKFLRPISLLNHDYKILSKLLYKRISSVIDELIQ